MFVFMVYLRRACALKTSKCVNIFEKSLGLSSFFCDILRYVYHDVVVLP